MVLVVAEDVVEEVYDVIERTFRDHAEIHEALDLLEIILGQADLVRRDDYAEHVGYWAERVRDRSDAPVLACAAAAKADVLVSGDRDILVLGNLGEVTIWRTRDVLKGLD